MPLEGSYVIWNNRGGSGKTNLTYHLAIKYAYRNPDKTVLVVDMCPQADLSHAFLGKYRNYFLLIKKKKQKYIHTVSQEN
jgi:cellulose biosynthesis protein BcsQ